jgi:hypothetical protein
MNANAVRMVASAAGGLVAIYWFDLGVAGFFAAVAAGFCLYAAMLLHAVFSVRILDPRWRLRLPVTGNWAGSIRRRSGAIDQRPESGTRVSGPDQSDFLHGNLLAEQSADL